MSINVSYFFNSAAPLPGVAKLLDKVLGCRFEPYQGDDSDLFCHLLSLETSLRIHHLEDDSDLDFAKYRYPSPLRRRAGRSNKSGAGRRGSVAHGANSGRVALRRARGPGVRARRDG